MDAQLTDKQIKKRKPRQIRVNDEIRILLKNAGVQVGKKHLCRVLTDSFRNVHVEMEGCPKGTKAYIAQVHLEHRTVFVVSTSSISAIKELWKKFYSDPELRKHLVL